MQDQDRDGRRFWLELREPRKVPERKGPWLLTGLAPILREVMAARPSAYITVVTIGHDGFSGRARGPANGRRPINVDRQQAHGEHQGSARPAPPNLSERADFTVVFTTTGN
jgi:hypothetical protein